MWLGLALTGVAACRPALDDRPWLIVEPRIVGWKAEPPEVSPGATVALQVVAIDPAGPADTSATAWTLCRTPKPLAENRPVAAECLAPSGADATGSPVTLAIPTDACRLFGPDTPQPAPGAPPTRPRDADTTGGYYQPITFVFAGARAVGLERVTCGLPDASFDVARAFQSTYTPNKNPTIAGLTFTVDGAAADPTAIPRGAAVEVGATWAPDAAEVFPVFDRASNRLLTTVEVLVGSWYVTGGELDLAAVEITDASTSTTWIAPPEAGAFEIVFLLRDSRGGVGAARADMVVK